VRKHNIFKQRIKIVSPQNSFKKEKIDNKIEQMKQRLKQKTNLVRIMHAATQHSKRKSKNSPFSVIMSVIFRN
jgi:hypothetical protein